jgi:hypothetical protein
MAILRHTDPDEVHAFDALYGDPGPLVGWARRRVEGGTGALRVLYRDGEGTARHSERVHCALAPLLSDALRPRFRVERTRVIHLQIPRSYGWRLLADPGADLPGTQPAGGGRCAPRRPGEARTAAAEAGCACGCLPGSTAAPAASPAEVARFVAEHGADAVARQERSGVPPLVTLADAALESGWRGGSDAGTAAANERILRALRDTGALVHAGDPYTFARSVTRSEPGRAERLVAAMRLIEQVAPAVRTPVPAALEAEDEDRADLLTSETPRRPRCPDVMVAPADRPEVLLRDSVHAAVRNAQRLLNAFHAYRVSAGLTGLRDAPLVEDCVYGDHTVHAVRSFQELVFPGMTAEHDSKIGSRTWEQLDAIEVPPGQTVARLTVESLAVTDDGFRSPLTWGQVVGLDTATIDVELVARGLPVATMPDCIAVTLSTRPAGHATGSGTVPTAVSWDVPRRGPDAASPRKVRYRVARPMGDLGPLLAVEEQVREVATVVRNGGTSDADFVKALGWAPRGRATQPNTTTASTGSAAGEVPDARTLFRAGGVEVLDVRVAARPNWQVPVAVARLVRSPADLFYYSGHGLSGSGKLAVDVGANPAACPSQGPYADWLGPGDLTAVWRSPMDLDVLVLAGCSVLRIDASTSPPTGPGVAWTALLRAKGGPLTALLGYRKGAPCDSPNGNRIAAAFARRVAAGSSRFAHDWLTVNGDENANNAVAIDERGYWWIEGTLLGSYDIKGPTGLP